MAQSSSHVEVTLAVVFVLVVMEVFWISGPKRVVTRSPFFREKTTSDVFREDFTGCVACEAPRVPNTHRLNPANARALRGKEVPHASWSRKKVATLACFDQMMADLPGMIAPLPWQNAEKARVESSSIVGYSEKIRSAQAVIATQVTGTRRNTSRPIETDVFL